MSFVKLIPRKCQNYIQCRFYIVFPTKKKSLVHKITENPSSRRVEILSSNYLGWKTPEESEFLTRIRFVTRDFEESPIFWGGICIVNNWVESKSGETRVIVQNPKVKSRISDFSNFGNKLDFVGNYIISLLMKYLRGIFIVWIVWTFKITSRSPICDTK